MNYEIILMRKNGELEYTTWFDQGCGRNYLTFCRDCGYFLNGIMVEIATEKIVAEF